MPKVCITRPKICVWAPSFSPKKKRIEAKGQQEKKEAGSTLGF